MRPTHIKPVPLVAGNDTQIAAPFGPLELSFASFAPFALAFAFALALAFALAFAFALDFALAFPFAHI